jgi:uncharacterized protein with PIN domain
LKVVERFGVRLRLHGGLDYFVERIADRSELYWQLTEPTSVKDVIESRGVPHPEVDRILVNGAPEGFTHVLRQESELDVYPVGFTDCSSPGSPLQRRHANRFVADGHLGKLARNLRLLGFDVAYHTDIDDSALLEIMQIEQRALLTRDRRLLMHKIVVDGYCPRSSDPTEQTVEVVRRFELPDEIIPFTRCTNCNGLLEGVDKSAVLDQLEPLTRIYYDEFRRCTGCGKIFWRGSHYPKLVAFLERLRGDNQI